jgi:hypothetical protein
LLPLFFSNLAHRDSNLQLRHDFCTPKGGVIFITLANCGGGHWEIAAMRALSRAECAGENMVDKIWDIPLSVKVETDTESKARLLIQNALGVQPKVRSYDLKKGEQKLLYHWKPIGSAPKDRNFLGCEFDIGLVYSAEWAGDRWMNLAANAEAKNITHWIEHPDISN